MDFSTQPLANVRRRCCSRCTSRALVESRSLRVQEQRHGRAHVSSGQAAKRVLGRPIAHFAARGGGEGSLPGIETSKYGNAIAKTACLLAFVIRETFVCKFTKVHRNCVFATTLARRRRGDATHPAARPSDCPRRSSQSRSRATATKNRHSRAFHQPYYYYSGEVFRTWSRPW